MYAIYYKLIVSCVSVNPVVAGSEWKGYQLYNHCNRDRFHHLTVKIIKTVRPHWFSAFVQVENALKLTRYR